MGTKASTKRLALNMVSEKKKSVRKTTPTFDQHINYAHFTHLFYLHPSENETNLSTTDTSKSTKGIQIHVTEKTRSINTQKKKLKTQTSTNRKSENISNHATFRLKSQANLSDFERFRCKRFLLSGL